MNDAIIRANWIALFYLAQLLLLLRVVAAIFMVGVASTSLGLAEIAQAFRIKTWAGYVWNMATESVGTIGGILIFSTC